MKSTVLLAWSSEIDLGPTEKFKMEWPILIHSGKHTRGDFL